ncbi:MAG: tetratricopeptide repeat protein [Desulfohalobiaceae bacterium]|nr:tetratricopeptide repeat protein [Desulfohalobiaceae bacterium]
MSSRKSLFLLALAALCLTAWGCASTSPSVSDNTRARIELANSQLQSGHPRRSLQELEPLKDKAQDVPEYHFLLGMTYLRLDGHKEQAIRELNTAVELAPKLGMAWNNLGLAYIRAGRMDDAEQALKKALSISTYLTPEYAAYNLSRLYRDRNQPEKAIRYANKALRENWRYLPGYFLLADLYTEQGQPEKAKKTLKRGVEAFPDHERLWLKYGKTQLRIGDKEQATQSFQRVLEIAPDSNSAKVARDYLDLPES